MSRTDHRVSVVIATMATSERRQSLLRAIDCLLTQEGVPALPIVVVNGTRFDTGLLADLRGRTDIRCLYLEQGSLPNALHVGAQAVDTELYAFLDDDDYYLPHALAARAAVLDGDPAIDAVASLGYREIEGDPVAIESDLEAIARDPLAALFNSNWLYSCGGLFRTASVTPDFFADLTPYMEWTLVALRLALKKRVGFLADKTFVTADTPRSLSKSPRHVTSAAELMERILRLDLPPHVRRLAKRKHADALHWAADARFVENDWRAAWWYHLRSVSSPYGLRYLPCTRRLMLAGLRQALSLGKPATWTADGLHGAPASRVRRYASGGTR